MVTSAWEGDDRRPLPLIREGVEELVAGPGQIVTSPPV
jgi:hypothetical protein